MKIAIAGYGVEGRSNYNYFSKQGHEITIVDEREHIDDLPENVPTRLGASAFERLDGFDIVVRTASLAPQKIKTNGKVWSATNEFFEKCPAPIIGVTGSKGKGTISSLIAAILRTSGKTIHLVGNIGVPALDVLSRIEADNLVVYELSSFQLWDIERSPHVAVVGVIEPDHLDIHGTFEDYVAAKTRIVERQTIDDTVVFNSSNEHSRRIAAVSLGAKVPYPDEKYVHVRDNSFYYDEQIICSVEELKLPGQHNLENACAAIGAAWIWVSDSAQISQALSEFKGLPHRLELIRSLDGVEYYDDNFSSATPALKVAVASFKRPVILIAGGYDRGIDYDDLAVYLRNQPQLKKILLIGATRELIAHALQVHGVTNYECVNDGLETVVRKAHSYAVSGDVVLMSPGCASFDMFKDFVERGEKFQEIVRAL